MQRLCYNYSISDEHYRSVYGPMQEELIDKALKKAFWVELVIALVLASLFLYFILKEAYFASVPLLAAMIYVIANLVWRSRGTDKFNSRRVKSLMAMSDELNRAPIELTVDNQGFHESTEGVQSHAAWDAVASYEIAGVDILVVHLSTGQKVIIPTGALTNDSDPMDELMKELTSRMIPTK